MGNYFNSEIIGKPTDSSLGVVFINPITERILYNEDGANPISSIEFKKVEEKTVNENGRVPLSIYLFFKPGTTENQVNEFVDWRVRNILASQTEFVDMSNSQMSSSVTMEASGTYAARVNIMAISRHPAQLYESISCFILFALLLWYWSKKKINLPEGRIFGIFLIILWSLRFAYEFLKENQESFEDNLSLNMGQILSIPLVLVGVYVLIRSFKQKESNS